MSSQESIYIYISWELVADVQFQDAWKLELLSEAPAISGALETYIAAERNLPGCLEGSYFRIEAPPPHLVERDQGIIKLSNSNRSIREIFRKMGIT